MFATSQRRRLSYYLSLPLVAAILFGLVAKLAALQRADMIADLADRVAHHDTAEATAAVRQLASMPRPPVAILVRAATSTDREVAEEARHAIGKLLRRLQRQIDSERRVGAAAQQLSELAEALAKQQPLFAQTDLSWVSNTTQRVLRLSNRIPSQQAPLVAMHCDTVLAAVGYRDASSVAEVATKDAAAAEAIDEPAAETNQQEARQAQLGGDVTAAATLPVEPATVSSQPPGSDYAADTARIVEGSQAAAEVSTRRWQATWSHPIFRMVPAMPIEAVPVHDRGADAEDDVLPLNPESQSLEQQPADSPLAGLDLRELLWRWQESEGADVFPLEEELTRRGFGRLSERLVELLFSSQPEDRLRLVDAVLTEPGIDARPWLMMLADDEHTDVRLMVVTIMATSKDAALVEKAWSVAIRDRDPRIASLAGPLRDRRNDTLTR